MAGEAEKLKYPEILSEVIFNIEPRTVALRVGKELRRLFGEQVRTPCWKWK